MAVLAIMNYGKYENLDAVSNVIRYILRIRKNENRQKELLSYGGYGINLFVEKTQIINDFLYVQNLHRIDIRKGRRIFHEVLSLSDLDYAQLGSNLNIAYQIAATCAYYYFEQGFQVVYALHWDPNKHLHIHFAVNTISFLTGKKWHTNYEENKLRRSYFLTIVENYIKMVNAQITTIGGLEYEQ